MNELCPIKNFRCPFCGYSQGTLRCGIEYKSSNRHFDRDGMIKKMRSCPNDSKKSKTHSRIQQLLRY